MDQQSKVTVRLFERPCTPGWVYPCTLDDIAARLDSLPDEHKEGLWAVGLVPSTRKEHWANGRYWFCDRPIIHIFSYPESLRIVLPSRPKIAQVDKWYTVERQFGMGIEDVDGRSVCVWSADNLRRFIVEHVLLHEIGHHVYYWSRKLAGQKYRRNANDSEQFAEDWAKRITKSG